MSGKTISASTLIEILDKAFSTSETVYDYYELNEISGIEYFAGEMNAIVKIAFEIKEKTGVTVFDSDDEGVQS